MASNYTNDDTITLLDGVNIKTQYGADLLKAVGFLDMPKAKEPLRHNWPDEHGTDEDNGAALYYQEQPLTMELLFVSETSLNDLRTKIKAAITAFIAAGLRHIKIPGVSGVRLVRYVSSTTTRQTNGITGRQVAIVKIELLEPSPAYYQFYSDRSANLNQVSLAITTTKTVTIYWGDGTSTIATASGTKTKTYAANGHYCIVVYGSVQGVSAITPTNAIAI